mgnify:CR=1 FL=1
MGEFYEEGSGFFQGSDADPGFLGGFIRSGFFWRRSDPVPGNLHPDPQPWFAVQKSYCKAMCIYVKMLSESEYAQYF